MHDTNPNPEKRMPPLVVLGLTGPAGSGCTTVGGLFADGKELVNILRFLGWVSPGAERLTIDWAGLNKEVDDQYVELARVRRIMSEYDRCRTENGSTKANRREDELRREVEDNFGKKLEGDFEEKVRELETDIKDELVKILEIREEVKSLEKLNDYYKDGKYLFQTISVSTLIVIRAIICIDEEKFALKNVGSTYYKRFIGVAKKMQEIAKKVHGNE